MFSLPPACCQTGALEGRASEALATAASVQVLSETSLAPSTKSPRLPLSSAPQALWEDLSFPMSGFVSYPGDEDGEQQEQGACATGSCSCSEPGNDAIAFSPPVVHLPERSRTHLTARTSRGEKSVGKGLQKFRCSTRYKRWP